MKFLLSHLITLLWTVSLIAQGSIMPGSKIYDVTKPETWGGDPEIKATPNNASDDDSRAINEALKAATYYLEKNRYIIDPDRWEDYPLITYQQLIYIPEGTYHLENSIVVPKLVIPVWGKKESCIWFYGEGNNKTIFKLKNTDEIGSFGSAYIPKPVVQFTEYALNSEPSDGNANIQLFATNFSIQVPKDQKYAVGMSYGCANLCAVRNVHITAEELGGHTGLAMTQFNNGPGWVENVTVEGFNKGIEIHDGWGEGYAFGEINLINQNPGGVGLYLADKQIAIENLNIEQSSKGVTPIHLLNDPSPDGQYGGAPHLTLLNAKIKTEEKTNAPAIKIDKGHTYLRNISTIGFGDEIINDHGTIRKFKNGNIEGEYISIHGKIDAEKENVIITEGAVPAKSLNHPSPTTPEIDPEIFNLFHKGDYTIVKNSDLNNEKELSINTSWVIVDPSEAQDDTDLVQAALNSGAPYVGILNTEPARISKTLIVNGQGNRNVELIMGYMSEFYVDQAISARKKPYIQNDGVFMKIESGTSENLFIKGFRIKAYEKTIADFTLFENNSNQTIVFEDVRCKDAPREYRNGGESIGSNVFFENVELSHRGVYIDTLMLFDRQNAWGRQFNIELLTKPHDYKFGKYDSKYLKETIIRPKTANRGGNIWIIGAKHGEHNGIFILTEGGGKTEFLSGYFNPARDHDVVVVPRTAHFLVKDKGSELAFVGQERIRATFDKFGDTEKPLPHENRFGVVVQQNGYQKIIKATDLPTYLTYEGFDPFNDSHYEIYDKKNHFRVGGLIRIGVD